jgi:hypothetical protein
MESPTMETTNAILEAPSRNGKKKCILYPTTMEASI